MGLQYFSEYFNNANEDVLKLKYSQTLNDFNLFNSLNINTIFKKRPRKATLKKNIFIAVKITSKSYIGQKLILQSIFS